MTSHLWCWSDIVSPQAVEAAMADEERARRRRQASNDTAIEASHDTPPVAA